MLQDGDGKKNIYFRVKDKAENEAKTSSYIIMDTTPPYYVSIKINNGASKINSTNVTIQIDAGDNITGISQIKYSTDGSTWSDWENYSDMKIIDLPPGEGKKTVYIKVKDKAGNEADFATDAILIIEDKDQEPPVSKKRSDEKSYAPQIMAAAVIIIIVVILLFFLFFKRKKEEPKVSEDPTLIPNKTNTQVSESDSPSSDEN
jgi:hypothetical protein